MSTFLLPAGAPPLSQIIAGRALPLGLVAPHPALRACVVVPVRDEQEAIGSLLQALADQRDSSGAPFPPNVFEVVLLLNNCTDRTAETARAFGAAHPGFCLHLAEVVFPSENAHVGKARQALFDWAFMRFQALQLPDGLILTTDADSRPAGDWITQNEAEIALGVDAVGGRVTIEPTEHAALPPAVRRFHLLDIGYRRALEELRSLYAPDLHDPFPRHHQHFGGSLAVTARAYARAGGMPLRRFNEDVALYRAIRESGGIFRHSYRARVQTSARVIGRASGGLADAIQWWSDQALEARPVLVESATAANERLRQLGVWSRENPGCNPPARLAVTPEHSSSQQSDEIQATLQALRELIAKVRSLTINERLGCPRGRTASVANVREFA